MRNLSESFGGEIEHLAFMSDMEKGLGKAIKFIFLNVEHRVCMRHLWKNTKKMFHCEDGIGLQNLVWTASNTYILNVWHMKLEEIFKISPQVYAYLNSLSRKWSKATFSEHIKNHSNTNNMSESFNAWVEEARNKPVVDLVDMIRAKIMEQRSQRNVISSSWRGQLVPHVEEYIRDITTRKEHFIIHQSTLTRAEVEGLHERHAVDLEKKDCTCELWQLSGLPCLHSAVYIGTTQHSLWYKLAYEGAISTIPGKEMWVAISDGEVVTTPLSLRPRGRPKKRRIKNFLETGKKMKLGHRCSRCNLSGHHRSTCKNPLNGEGDEIGYTSSTI
ncbi:uncharacterized protein LOC110098307 [Dendrobium catenatum]|uniref:uncharacterized protein LOC110098307 n=1 Tax=Dendrobium catenatum TaxID=906689 RepID=UPI00109F75CC|nr:uncharacterized protein LOC110098307 [Dendrobium catenatum]